MPSLTSIPLPPLPRQLPETRTPRSPPPHIDTVTSNTLTQPDTNDISWKRPSIKQVILPRRILFGVTLLLLLLLGGCVAGLVVTFVNMEGSQTYGTVEWILSMLTIAITFGLLRQFLVIYLLFRPPPKGAPSQTQGNLPTWLTGRLPTYIDAVGDRHQATGDVEDVWIVGEALPVYGSDRGSKLLLRSLSRGGEVGVGEGEDMVEVVRVEERDIGVRELTLDGRVHVSQA